MHEAFYGKYNGIFRACASSVYQASPRGEGPGDEANAVLDRFTAVSSREARGLGTRLETT